MVSRRKYVLPEEFIYDDDIVLTRLMTSPETLDRVKNLTLTADDVLLATYPKAGTTWMQEILYLVTQDIDVEKATHIPITERSRFLEANSAARGNQMSKLLQDPHPWLIKTHLPCRFFSGILDPQMGRVVVVMRNPKDNLVSLFHFFNNAPHFQFKGDWNDFFEHFRNRRTLYGDMLDWNISWWNRRDHPSVLIVTYEQMKRDVTSVIRQVARHCGKAISEEAVQTIAGHTAFKNMKQNPMVNYSLMPTSPVRLDCFMRKGEIGDWRNYFSETQSNYMDKRTRDLYEPAGLHFDYM